MATEMQYLATAIRNLKPGCDFTIINGEITEFIGEGDEPTWEELQAEVTSIKNGD